MTVIFGAILGFMLYQGEAWITILSVGGVFLLVYAFFLHLNSSTTYTITDDGVLKVTCGIFFNQRYDIKRITSITKTRNLISSPAPSLDRIQLTYGEFGNIIISPVNKNAFAKNLLKVNPKIENRLT